MGSSGRQQAQAQTRAASIQAQAAREVAERQSNAAVEAAQISSTGALEAAKLQVEGSLGAAGLMAGATAMAAGLQSESAANSLAVQEEQFAANVERLSPYADLGEQSIDDVQRASTLEGFQDNLNNIMSTDAFTQVRAESQRQAAGALSSAGLNRSGAAAQSAADININTALGIEASQYGRNMNNVAVGQAAAGGQNVASTNYANSVTGINTNMANATGDIIVNGAGSQGNFMMQGANAAAQGVYNSSNALAGGVNQSAYYQGTGQNAAAGYTANGLIGAANARAQAKQNRINTALQIAGIAAGVATAGMSTAATAGATASGAGMAGSTATTAGTSFFSDPRLKDNMQPIGKIADLTLFEWDWKDWVKGITGTEMCTGFDANEVQEKYPDCVVQAGDYLAVLYEKLHPQLRARLAA